MTQIPATDSEQAAISVMSFNLRGAREEWDGINAWSNRKDLNTRVIRKCSPDVIGFQEVQTGNLEAYAEDLPEYGFLLGPQYNNEAPYCYTTIAWRKSRFELTSSGGWWLSPTPWTHSGGWETDCFRSAAWAMVRDIRTGLEFLFVNTHLDHISEQARVEQTRLLLRLAAACRADNTPMVVTGDFNCNPGSDAYNLFLSCGFEDTWRTAGQSDDSDVFTYHAFEGRLQDSERRIDWIMLSDKSARLRVQSARIVRDHEPPLYPSDHYPVITDFAVAIG